MLVQPHTIDEIIRYLPSPKMTPLTAPTYNGNGTDSRRRLGFAVESMRRHMTDEGWQIFEGLEANGYVLCGNNLTHNSTNVADTIYQLNPSTIILQDKREWDVQPRDFREPKDRFTNYHSLKENGSIFKVTILKDAHQKPDYHRQSAEEIGCHAWIIYYHPRIVQHLAPYVRQHHLIRTYHTIDRNMVPQYTSHKRKDCILSGAISGVYPLRASLATAHKQGRLPSVDYFKHPGYHRNGSNTPEFLKTLSQYKVSICTASIFGYALRKIIESTACGNIVITDLPYCERLPFIDGNLVRVSSSTQPEEIEELVKHLVSTYDPDKQEHFALLAKKHYDFRAVTRKLVDDVESMRRRYLM